LVDLFPQYEIVNKTKFYATYPRARGRTPKIQAFVNFFQERLR